jgi:hypothetical protein
MNKIEDMGCVYCGKKPCVCGTGKHSPKPVIKPKKLMLAVLATLYILSIGVIVLLTYIDGRFFVDGMYDRGDPNALSGIDRQTYDAGKGLQQELYEFAGY